MLQGRLNVEDFRYLQEANANYLFTIGNRARKLYQKLVIDTKIGPKLIFLLMK